MAETDQERTEEPTEKRKREAREKGQIARSKEMGTAFVLVSAAVAFFWFGESPCDDLSLKAQVRQWY